MTRTPPQAEPGSLRDPDGQLILFEDRIFRGLSSGSFSVLSHLTSQGVLQELQEKNLTIKSDINPNDAAIMTQLKKHIPQFPHFIEHEKLNYVTYPCEWTFSMLCDAALLHLKIQEQLLEKGFSLKDASAYNVLFRHGREIFIDIGSFEIATSPVWPAYGQFCRMFLFPLILSTHRRVDTKSYFLSHMDGISLSETAQILGFFGRLRPSFWIDILFPYLFEKRSSSGSREFKVKGDSEGHLVFQKFNLRRLSRVITRLRKGNEFGTSHWLSYKLTNTYSDKEIDSKKQFLSDFLDTYKPKSLLDLGCNTGDYAVMAASRCENVVAIDSDHDSIESLYLRTKKDNINITPIWMDLANPTPAIGFQNRERKQFDDRFREEAVVAFALVHHLLISSGIPLEKIRDFLWSLSSHFLLVEYIHPNDPQFQSLIGFRQRSYDYLSSNQFERIFSHEARKLREVKITPYRTLFLFSRMP